MSECNDPDCDAKRDLYNLAQLCEGLSIRMKAISVEAMRAASNAKCHRIDYDAMINRILGVESALRRKDEL